MFSQRLQLREIKVINQAFWAVHPYGSDDIFIGSVNVTAPRDEGINNDDGIDPDSCSNVLVDECWVSVGDNSVAIKSGMNW
jgi:polygalacturonase